MMGYHVLVTLESIFFCNYVMFSYHHIMFFDSRWPSNPFFCYHLFLDHLYFFQFLCYFSVIFQLFFRYGVMQFIVLFALPCGDAVFTMIYYISDEMDL